MTEPSDPLLDPGEQLTLPGIARVEARRAKPPKTVEPPKAAATDPIARVLVDLPLAHLDRPFDYLVPESMAETAVPGARVKVRFAGQDVDGFVLDRASETDHTGRMQPLRRVVSAEPVLRPEIAELTAAVAARYAGTRSDVLRLAVPARHAATEKEPSPERGLPTVAPDPAALDRYTGGPPALDALAAGESPRAVWTVLPGDDWTAPLVEAIVATAASGRGSLVCVPDRRDLDRLDRALSERIGTEHHVVLSADHGPARRYRSFLAAARGAVRIVIGTRSAVFAPVTDLGLVAIWDDGDDLYAEPRAPYPHAREVLLLRAGIQDCALITASYARSVEAEYLLRTGWAAEVRAPRETVRTRLAAAISGDSDAVRARDPAGRGSRIPKEAFELLREGLASGPVLVQTPRSGYAASLACDRCRAPAACGHCHGPLRITAAQRAPECAWCATPAPGWTCPECGGQGLRAPVLGERRTAEELGRAFPSIPVRSSSADRIVERVDARPSIVVATPGAEPVAVGGYAAVLLLDTWLPLARADLRAGEEAFRRWANAVGLIAPGGRVLAVGDPAQPTLQAVVRWDPAGLARRELADRQEAHLAPASRMATVSGPVEEVESALAALALPVGAEVLGPVPLTDQYDEEQLRYVVRVPRSHGAELSAALTTMQAQRSARKAVHLRVEVDPVEIA